MQAESPQGDIKASLDLCKCRKLFMVTLCQKKCNYHDILPMTSRAYEVINFDNYRIN